QDRQRDEKRHTRCDHRVPLDSDEGHRKAQARHAGRQPGPVTQQPRQQQFRLASLDGFSTHPAGPPSAMPRPLRLIWIASATSTTTKSRRTLSFDTAMRMRAPRSEPTTDPRATGPATAGTMSPRMKYAPALAAAVTPIMKLEVAEETLMGRRRAVSIAGIFSTPLPIPKRAE